MRTLPSLFAILLSLTLMVTAQGMAFARGQAPAKGQMVLCTGQGMVMVFTDAEGRPTSPPQLCVDAALALTGLDLQAPIVRLHPADASVMTWQFGRAVGVNADLPRLSARDPPRV